MKLWLIGLGLALLCIISADSKCSGDHFKGHPAAGLLGAPLMIKEKMFLTGVGNDCEYFLKHVDKAMVTEIATTEENKLRIISDFPGKNGCKKIQMDFEKRDDETYYHKSDWGEKNMKVVSTDCETYVLVVVKIQKKEKTSTLVALYTKEPKLTDQLKEMFVEQARSLGIRDDQMMFPTEVACPKEE